MKDLEELNQYVYNRNNICYRIRYARVVEKNKSFLTANF